MNPLRHAFSTCLSRRLKTVAICLFFVTSSVQARSYSFLIDAIRDYSQNPTPETQSRLTAAQNKAIIIDWGLVLAPATLIIGYILIRFRKKKSKTAEQGRPANPSQH